MTGTTIIDINEDLLEHLKAPCDWCGNVVVPEPVVSVKICRECLDKCARIQTADGKVFIKSNYGTFEYLPMGFTC